MSEVGEVVVVRYYEPDFMRERIRIKRADPQARISAHLVLEIRNAREPYAQCTDDGVLTLTDDYGQRFIYRIDWTDYRESDQSFRMEWPD